MTDDRRRADEKVDDEFSAQHGTVLSEESITDEAHPEEHPGTPGQLARKVKDEAAEGEGILDKAKRALQEVDRDVSGEYERREDRTAPPPLPDQGR